MAVRRFGKVRRRKVIVAIMLPPICWSTPNVNPIAVPLKASVNIFAKIKFTSNSINTKKLPKNATIKRPEHKPSNGPSSPIVAATPPLLAFVQPKAPDMIDDAKVKKNRTVFLMSLEPKITEMRTPSIPKSGKLG